MLVQEFGFFLGVLRRTFGERRATVERNRHVGVRFSEIERQALIRLARRQHRRPSETIRELVRKAAQQAGCWPVGRNRDAA